MSATNAPARLPTPETLKEPSDAHTESNLKPLKPGRHYSGSKGEAKRAAAALYGSSVRTLERAERILRHAPELGPRIMAGELTLGQAERLMLKRAELPLLRIPAPAGLLALERMARECETLEIIFATWRASTEQQIDQWTMRYVTASSKLQTFLARFFLELDQQLKELEDAPANET